MLRGEVIRDEPVVDDDEIHRAGRTRPGQRVVGWEQDREDRDHDPERQPDEAHTLAAEQGAVAGRAISEIGRAEPMSDPEAERGALFGTYVLLG